MLDHNKISHVGRSRDLKLDLLIKSRQREPERSDPDTDASGLCHLRC